MKVPLQLQTISWISDIRGNFAEIFRDEMAPHQISTLVIAPRKQRGGHYHRYKQETFVLISGKARVELRDGPIGHPQTTHQTLQMTSENGPQKLCIPPGQHHTFFNEGNALAIFIIHCDFPFDPEAPDTFLDF